MSAGPAAFSMASLSNPFLAHTSNGRNLPTMLLRRLSIRLLIMKSDSLFFSDPTSVGNDLKNVFCSSGLNSLYSSNLIVPNTFMMPTCLQQHVEHCHSFSPLK